MIGHHSRFVETLADKAVDVPFRNCLACVNRRANVLERSGPYRIDTFAGLDVHVELFRSPARFKKLDQIGGGSHFHASAPHQFQSAAVHQRNIWNGAIRRVLHRHTPAAGE